MCFISSLLPSWKIVSEHLGSLKRRNFTQLLYTVGKKGFLFLAFVSLYGFPSPGIESGKGREGSRQKSQKAVSIKHLPCQQHDKSSNIINADSK